MDDAESEEQGATTNSPSGIIPTAGMDVSGTNDSCSTCLACADVRDVSPNRG